jgi:DNA polymerase-3 subunit alpha
MTRHASVHAAGVVIAPGPITEYAPLYKGARDEIVTQWTMKDVERMGLLKMDFLGLEHAHAHLRLLDEIKRTTGVALDIDTIPLDDAKAVQIFQDGQTYGIFQFESSGMRGHPPQGEAAAARRPHRPERALPSRPAAQRHGRRLHRAQAGQDGGQYEMPELEPVLADTYGVIAYQEQVMRISNVLAGFSLGEADLLAQGHGQEESRGHGEDARQVCRGRRQERAITRRRRPTSSS